MMTSLDSFLILAASVGWICCFAAWVLLRDERNTSQEWEKLWRSAENRAIEKDWVRVPIQSYINSNREISLQQKANRIKNRKLRGYRCEIALLRAALEPLCRMSYQPTLLDRNTGRLLLTWRRQLHEAKVKDNLKK